MNKFKYENDSKVILKGNEMVDAGQPVAFTLRSFVCACVSTT